VLELVFMKAKLASADPKTQISLMRKFLITERVILHTVRLADHQTEVANENHRDKKVTTSLRTCV
jgi:hypothetical protein